MTKRKIYIPIMKPLLVAKKFSEGNAGVNAVFYMMCSYIMYSILGNFEIAVSEITMNQSSAYILSFRMSETGFQT